MALAAINKTIGMLKFVTVINAIKAVDRDVSWALSQSFRILNAKTSATSY